MQRFSTALTVAVMVVCLASGTADEDSPSTNHYSPVDWPQEELCKQFEEHFLRAEDSVAKVHVELRSLVAIALEKLEHHKTDMNAECLTEEFTRLQVLTDTLLERTSVASTHSASKRELLRVMTAAGYPVVAGKLEQYQFLLKHFRDRIGEHLNRGAGAEVRRVHDELLPQLEGYYQQLSVLAYRMSHVATPRMSQYAIGSFLKEIQQIDSSSVDSVRAEVARFAREWCAVQRDEL